MASNVKEIMVKIKKLIQLNEKEQDFYNLLFTKFYTYKNRYVIEYECNNGMRGKLFVIPDAHEQSNIINFVVELEKACNIRF